MVQAESDFRAWLQKRGMGERGAGDVCSRLKRLTRFADLNAVKSERELEARLLQSDEFASVVPSVRSQLKRAGNLYLQFLSEIRQ